MALKLISSRSSHDYSVSFVGNLVDTTTNYAVFNPPSDWQGQNRLWIRIPEGVWKLSIDYEGESTFTIDGLPIRGVGRVERMLNVTTDTPFAVKIDNPTDRSHNVIVGLTKYTEPLSLSLFVASAAAWLRRWQHGAKASQCSARGVRRRWGRLEVRHSETRGLELLGSGACLPHTGHVLGAGKRRPHLRAQARADRNPAVGRAGYHLQRRGVHSRLWRGRGTHVHAPRLTPAGGGR